MVEDKFDHVFWTSTSTGLALALKNGDNSIGNKTLQPKVSTESNLQPLDKVIKLSGEINYADIAGKKYF